MRTTLVIGALALALPLVACNREGRQESALASSPTSPSPGAAAPSGPTAPPGAQAPVLQELPPPPSQEELEAGITIDPSEADALLEQLRREIEEGG